MYILHLKKLLDKTQEIDSEVKSNPCVYPKRHEAIH
jgi:hypothetical protein